jgi:hypothetical protein
MNITDDYIKKKFFSPNGRLNGNYSTKEYMQKNCPDILEYIENKYSDSESYRETFLRIYFNIENRPKCPFCDKPVKWRGKRYLNKLFADTCGDKECWLKYREQTMIDKFGVSHLGCPQESVEKIKKTKLERYGDPGYCNKEKRFTTNLEKYGNIVGVNEEVIEKRKQTSIEHFGVPVPTQSEIVKEKYRQTCLKKYGVDNYRKCEEFINKIHNTKKKNGTVNTSKYEENAYVWLTEKFGVDDIVRQYKDERYVNPSNNHKYHCDFYIKSLDLFIELQMYWGHGPHPFDENSVEDIEYLNKVKEISKIKPIYNRLVDGWTHSDVVKRNAAAAGNIKLLEIYDRNITKDKLLADIMEYCNGNI